MSRHLAAYFAIVGTLAFAPGGAANAGQFNIPHFNIMRPQIGMPTPHLSNMPPLHLSNSQPHISGPMPISHGLRPNILPPTRTTKIHPHEELKVLDQPQQQSTTGTMSGNLFSNVSGGAVPSRVSGGAVPSRFRVIEDTRGRFAVVEGRSENIVAGGFESSKAAWAWIANHV
jgi:hypothetical protein